jgi:predicted  nucleic acid-binding Zn-ribbon protein
MIRIEELEAEVARLRERIAALERALRKAQDRIYYAVDWRHEGADETLKQVWREIEEALGEAAAPEGDYVATDSEKKT